MRTEKKKQSTNIIATLIVTALFWRVYSSSVSSIYEIHFQMEINMKRS